MKCVNKHHNKRDASNASNNCVQDNRNSNDYDNNDGGILDATIALNGDII